MNVPFSPPDITQSEISSVKDVLESGWITTGPKVTEFENKIAKYVGVPKALCLNSQTACAEMALRLLGIGPGDEVIVPAYTYTASASVIDHVGAKIIMVDCQKDSPELDYDCLESLITEKTKAIIPVDIGGIPCDYDKLYQIVDSKRSLFKPSGPLQEAMGRISVNADTAHSLGAWRRTSSRALAVRTGRTEKIIKAGALADFSSFSFHAVKNLTTAEGGALTWNTIPGVSDEDIYKKLKLMSCHGQSKDAAEKLKGGNWEYDILGLWYKCNMTDIAAAMGISQLNRYLEILEKRKRIIEKYDEALRPIGISTLNHFAHTYASSGHLYITRIPGISEERRNDIIRLMADGGVSTNVHYKPLPMMTGYKNLGFKIADFPNALSFYSKEITLPLFSTMTDEQADFVIEAYTNAIRKAL